MPAYIELNGHACATPEQVLREIADFNRGPIKVDYSVSDWQGKANQFTHRRGVDPSYGWLITTHRSVSSESSEGGELRIVYDDGSSFTFEQIYTRSAKKLTPALQDSKGFYIVEVLDQRYALAESFVGERFNLVTAYDPSGGFVYDSETTDEVLGVPVPWTWQQIIDKLWIVPDESLLNTGGVTFPLATPQDFDFRYTTRRDALEMILQWCGMTIVPDFAGGFKLATLHDSANASILALIAAYKDVAVIKDRRVKQKAAGYPAPAKFQTHFRRLNPPNIEVSQYHKIEKIPTATNKSKKEISVRLPVYYVDDGGIPTDMQPGNVASAWLVTADRWHSMFPPQETTYIGFRLYPSDDHGAATRMFPSAFVESVTWFNTGAGAKTKLVSVIDRPWVITPRELTQSSSDVVVYEFRLCEDPRKIKYLDNKVIAEHDAGEVAVLYEDGDYSCWQLIGVAPECKTGQCSTITRWGSDCYDCNPCFGLFPCGDEEAEPTIVRGNDWWQYSNRVVKIDGPGHEGCYGVVPAPNCSGNNIFITTANVTAVYDDCAGCGCYELELCDSEEPNIFVDNDLRQVIGVDDPDDCLNKYVRFRGVCYKIVGFVNPCGTTPTHWDYDYFECFFGIGIDRRVCPFEVADCNGCCFLLTPCEGQDGDPDPVYAKFEPNDDFNVEDFINNDGTTNGRTVLIEITTDEFVCYTISEPVDCIGETVILVEVLSQHDDCESCGLTCWKECGTATVIRTFSDMSEVPDNPDVVVRRAQDDKCYYKVNCLPEDDEIDPVEFDIEFIVDEGAESCDICATPKVKLVESCDSGCNGCEGTIPPAPSEDVTEVTDNPTIIANVGAIYKYEGKCVKSEWADPEDEVTTSDPCVQGPFELCQDCLNSPSRKEIVSDVFFTDTGELIVKKVTIEGLFKVCGETETEIADQEECEA